MILTERQDSEVSSYAIVGLNIQDFSR